MGNGKWGEEDNETRGEGNKVSWGKVTRGKVDKGR